jgi:hypothetical protein
MADRAERPVTDASRRAQTPCPCGHIAMLHGIDRCWGTSRTGEDVVAHRRTMAQCPCRSGPFRRGGTGGGRPWLTPPKL